MKKRVCVIDDDEDVRDVISYVLEEDGFEVLPFGNPEEALSNFEKSKEYPHFILLDYSMPKMNGAAFIRKIRSDYRDTLGKIPCALSSANGEIPEPVPEDVLALKKPMDLDHLLGVVRDNCL